MNQEELDLYKRLQGVFREKMGDVEKYDPFTTEYHQDNYHICTEARGGKRPAIVDENLIEHRPEFVIRLPLPIDPRNPERGLWGMIRGDMSIINHVGLEPMSKVNVYIDALPNRDYRTFIDDTITIALLKALCHQGGV